MKNKARLGVILYLVIVIAAMAGVIALVVYDIVVNKQVKSDTLLKAVLVFATLAISLFRVFGIGRKRLSPAVLRQQFAEFVGDAFSKDAKKEKAFFRAIGDVAAGKYDSALKSLTAMERDWNTRQERFAVLFFTALCYDELRAKKKAIELYEAALGVQENSTAASNLGICYQAVGDNEKAVDAYVRAIHMDPDNAYPYNNLAQLYIREGEFEGALVYAEQALACKNNFYQALSAKAICHAMMGEDEAYENALARAVACGANRQNIEYTVASMRQ